MSDYSLPRTPPPAPSTRQARNPEATGIRQLGSKSATVAHAAAAFNIAHHVPTRASPSLLAGPSGRARARAPRSAFASRLGRLLRYLTSPLSPLGCLFIIEIQQMSTNISFPHQGRPTAAVAHYLQACVSRLKSVAAQSEARGARAMGCRSRENASPSYHPRYTGRFSRTSQSYASHQTRIELPRQPSSLQ